MTGGLILAVITVVLVAVIAALVAAGETALTRISRPRAEALAAESLPGADSLAAVAMTSSTPSTSESASRLAKVVAGRVLVGPVTSLITGSPPLISTSSVRA